jgi:cytochrome c oxidase subunit IV
MAQSQMHTHVGHVAPIGLYVAVFLMLMVLTGVTVWVASVDLGAFNTIVALAIALLKATVVMLFFMHLRWSSPLVLLFVGSGFFFLGILLVLTLSDYLSRGWLGFPGT